MQNNIIPLHRWEIHRFSWGTKENYYQSEVIRTQLATYKKIRPLSQTDLLYRLRVPQAVGEASARMIVAENKFHAFLTYLQSLVEPNPACKFLRLASLSAEAQYRMHCLISITLHMIAGLEEISGGNLYTDSRCINDISS